MNNPNESEYLVMFFCKDCEEEEYFSLDSLPGGEEHCEYCEHCGGLLIPESYYYEELSKKEPTLNG